MSPPSTFTGISGSGLVGGARDHSGAIGRVEERAVARAG